MNTTSDENFDYSNIPSRMQWWEIKSMICCFADFFVDTLRAWQAANQMRAAEVEMRAVHTKEEEAAALLGVDVNASPDEVRSALRRKLGAGGIHPDHGGDGEEAMRLIAAKYVLIERAKTIGSTR